MNYLGVVEYLPEQGYMAWYYSMYVVSDRVRGIACGGGMCDLEGCEIIVVGNTCEFDELLTEPDRSRVPDMLFERHPEHFSPDIANLTK